MSDHSPCTPDLKAGSFFEAWGGIASVELGLRAVWTQARRRGFALEDVARWMSAGPAAIAGLRRKGAIDEGRDADLVVFEPDDASEIEPSELHHRNPVTPYAGRRLDGRVAGHVRSGCAGLRGRAVPERPRGPAAGPGRGVSDFTTLPDLAARRLGGMVLVANDEFFAPKENLLKPEAPVFDPDRYTDRGKEMDGWETRRRREPGHDWCIVRLGVPGIVRGVVVDTSFFRGNYPDRCSVEGAVVDGDDVHGAEWFELLPESALEGDAVNRFDVALAAPSHAPPARTIFPDGGVARLRVHGEPLPDLRTLTDAGGRTDARGVRSRADSCWTRATCSSRRRTT